MDFLNSQVSRESHMTNSSETPETDTRNHLEQSCTKCQQQESRIKEMQKKCKVLQKKLTQLKKRYSIYQKVNEPNGDNNQTEIVRLNVGGVVFHVKKENLIGNGNDNFFSCLFSHENMIERDEDGNIFIDRDPDLFTFILHLLRSGSDAINHEMLQQIGYERIVLLEKELEFYQFTDLSSKVNLYHLQLSEISHKCKQKLGLAKGVSYEWKELEIVETNFGITYKYTPIDAYDRITLPLLPVTMLLSETDDPRRFNFVKIHIDKGRNVVVGLMQKGETRFLGNTASSFGIDYNHCINNQKKRLSENWGLIDTDFFIGLWFDITTRNLIMYHEKVDGVSNETKKIMAFKGCRIDATKDFVFAVELCSGNTISVLKNARHPERPSIEDEKKKEMLVGTAASTSNQKGNDSTSKKKYANKRRRRRRK